MLRLVVVPTGATSRLFPGEVKSALMLPGLRWTNPTAKSAAMMSTTCTEVHTSLSSSIFSPRSPVVTGQVAIPLSNGLKTQADIGTKNAPSGKSEQKFKLTLDTINPYVKNMEYAVRGKMPQEAAKIEAAIRKGSGDHPFKNVVYCNIGDCHAMGQRPLTFVRQLLAACTHPELLATHDGPFPSDVVERAQLILDNCGGRSIGAYSESSGIKIIRKHVAEFISQRDSFHCSYENVYLLNGASEGIKTMLFMAIKHDPDKRTGIMVPLPQYPLYSAAVAQLNAEMVSYILDENSNWSLDVSELRRRLYESRKTCNPRVLVVINPGNPTGQYLPVENMREIIEFCHEEGLLLFTDEVYQENIYIPVEFQSFRKVLHDMGPQYNDLQMVSFNSTSKGFFGECGIRGGYMHIRGMDTAVMKQIYKNVSVSLCPNTPGQIVTDALVKRPRPGDPSYPLYKEELDSVLRALADKAELVHERLNSIDGVKCNKVQGAMYAYPQVEIPVEAWEDCRKEDPDMQLDMYYCLEFLRQQGVCVVPGSGFGKLPDRWHFRMTILPPLEKLEEMLARFEEFHTNFTKKYRP